MQIIFIVSAICAISSIYYQHTLDALLLSCNSDVLLVQAINNLTATKTILLNGKVKIMVSLDFRAVVFV